ncbi:unnamed protein product [Phyllotreta striolata]|uniref:Enkurin domain-containing protein n=1 Tax=Phyllotreta striolata TaxID=444603 RepID=A0A9N9TMR5_PHYSR|nr:unnamed protein product [Phyllotreta striolata]
MSIVLLTQHDENIYDIFKGKETNARQVKLRYKTPADEVKIVYPELQVEKKKYGVMGAANYDLPDPHNFLKKRSGKPCYPKPKSKKEPAKPCMPHKLPDVPKTKELVKLYSLPKDDKDFIVKNIDCVKGQPGKEHEPCMVTDKYGNKEPAKVLEPLYVKCPTFGQTPHYLKAFLRQREIAFQKMREAKVTIQPICKYLTKHRRTELLDGMKQNWEELQKQFQGLSICTDILPKILRKSKLEKQLRQLERDIVLVERHPYIYVYDDEIV